MNKKMRELLTKMQAKRDLAKGYMDGENKDMQKAASILDEVDELQKEFDIEKRLFEADKAENEPTETEIVKAAEPAEKADGFVMMAKKLNKKRLSETEKALIVDGTDGENYLVPEDVNLAISELRRQYVSAKDIINVMPANTLSGSFNWEAGDIVGLKPLVDGQAIDQTDQPSFTRQTWNIDFFAKLIPVSNILQGAERAGLLTYINKWFVKNAVFTENAAIFEALKSNKSPVAYKGYAALKSALNKDLDPALKIGGVVVTNQTGFDVLDQEVDENGRPMLQANPANATEKLFQGLPVRVFSDAQLPNDESGLAPIFAGSLKDGVTFMDYQKLEFATSSDFLFNVNQTAIRVIEGFDVFQTDKDAYLYGTIEPTAPSAPSAPSE